MVETRNFGLIPWLGVGSDRFGPLDCLRGERRPPAFGVKFRRRLTMGAQVGVASGDEPEGPEVLRRF
jgi:hypothetical protein